MREIRNSNLIIGKDGHGSITAKISLPTKWIKDLGFDVNDKQAMFEILDNKMIIRKKEKNMLLIKKENFERVNHLVDYELENGVLLYEEDWNTEVYTNGYDPENEKETNKCYKPIHKFEIDNINLDDLEENSDAWNNACEIVGFKEV